MANKFSIPFLSLLICTTLMSFQIKAQNENGSAYERLQKTAVKKMYHDYNFIKTNLTSILLKNYSLQYERILNRKFSVALQYRIMPSTGIPFKSSIINSDNKFEDNFNKTIEDVRLSNFAITPELRFYLSKKGYGRGFYMAPFYRYASYTTNDLNVFYTDENDVESSLKLSGKLNTSTGGILFGVQSFLGKHVVLDLWLLGPHLGNGKGTLIGTASKPLTQSEQDDLKQQLDDIGIPLSDKTANVNANGASLKLDGPWGGVRSGISLGVKF